RVALASVESKGPGKGPKQQIGSISVGIIRESALCPLCRRRHKGQNLTTQWHVRYGGRGIMIYWHVERKSLCIHSQLKSPSSSEGASLIEGGVHPFTERGIGSPYGDFPRPSPGAVAFCWLAGFPLPPRVEGVRLP